MTEDKTAQLRSEGLADQGGLAADLIQWLQDELPEETRRLFAIVLRESGVEEELVLSSLGCSTQQLHAWIARYADAGVEGLRNWQDGATEVGDNGAGAGDGTESVQYQLALVMTHDEQATCADEPVAVNEGADAMPVEYRKVESSGTSSEDDEDCTQMVEGDGTTSSIGTKKVTPQAEVSEDPRIGPAPLTEAGSEGVPAPSATQTSGDELANQEPAESRRGVWKTVEPLNKEDPVDHEMAHSLRARTGWRIVAASRRGRQHAHEGRYREDAYAIGTEGGWHLAVVADGAGSASLSRVGSRIAVETCRRQLIQAVQAAEESDDIDLVVTGVTDGFRSAWSALADEARDREIGIRELATTLLVVAHKPTADGHLIVSGQVGDGLLAVSSRKKGIAVLAQPDQGQFAGETLFLTSISPEVDLADRVRSHRLSGSLECLLAMTDGVADDFLPVERQLPKLTAALNNVMATGLAETESKLLELLSYNRPGSFDDRTLAVIAAPRFEQPGEEPG